MRAEGEGSNSRHSECAQGVPESTLAANTSAHSYWSDDFFAAGTLLRFLAILKNRPSRRARRFCKTIMGRWKRGSVHHGGLEDPTHRERGIESLSLGADQRAACSRAVSAYIAAELGLAQDGGSSLLGWNCSAPDQI